MSGSQSPGMGRGAPAWVRAAAPAGWAALLALLAGLVVLGVLLLAHRFRASSPVCVHSDSVYGVEVCKDLLGRGYERTNWHLPYAPQLFPETVLLLPCVALFRDMMIVFLAYNLLLHGLSAIVLACLFRHTGLRLREAVGLACSGQLFLLAALLDRSCADWLLIVFVPACHTGAVLAGLLLWLLVVRTLHRPARWWEAALFVAVGGVAVFSDRLVLAQFIGPMAVTVLVLAAFRAVTWRKALETCVLAGASYGCYSAIMTGLARCPVVLLPLSNVTDLEKMQPALVGLLKGLPLYVKGQYVVIYTFFALALLALAAGLYQALRVRRARLAVAADPGPGAAGRYRPAAAVLPAVAVWACLCNLAAIAVSGIGHSPATPRYLLAALFLPFLFLGLSLRLLPGRPLALLGRLFPLAAVLFAAYEFSRAEALPRFALSELSQPYSELARTLDRLAREGKIVRGLATYWDARQLEYETHRHVPIMAVHGHGEPWLHLQNPNAYLAPGRSCLEVPRYNFLVFNPDPPLAKRAEDVCRLFGSPREKVACGGREIWIYDGLIATPLTQFLRSMLAARCRAQLPCQGPAVPRRLSRPARNFAPATTSARVTLKPDQEVRVCFSAPVHGTLLDLGGQFDGRYEITFRRGEQEVGKVEAPQAGFPGVSAYYLPTGPGNQSRLVTVPPWVRARGWTSATVRTAGGPGTFALSHFLVYDTAGRHVSARQMQPGGRWRFEAEHQVSGYQGPDAVVADPLASEGKARFSPRTFAGFVAHGPYLPLEPGRYRVEFHVRVEADGVEEVVGSVDVISGQGKYLHARRELRAAEFAGQTGYQKFTLEFESELDLNDCEFRVFSYGKAAFYVDRVELVCER